MNCRRPISILLLVGMATFVGAVAAQEARAQVTRVEGKVTLKQADGTVTVNGTSAISGATVFSDSTVTTAKGSSAVVSLGKLGRVEVLPDTTMKLTYTDDGYTAMLSQGRVRLSTPSGTATATTATATTNDGSVVSTGRKAAEFLVDVTCGNTFVAVKKGTVELRAGNSVKQIAAGNQDSAGTATPGCRTQEN